MWSAEGVAQGVARPWFSEADEVGPARVSKVAPATFHKPCEGFAGLKGVASKARFQGFPILASNPSVRIIARQGWLCTKDL